MRQRSAPQTFDEKIAAEKSRVVALADGLPHGPEKEALLEDQAARYRCPRERLVVISGIEAAELGHGWHHARQQCAAVLLACDGLF